MVLGEVIFALTVNWNRAEDTLECLESLVLAGIEQSCIIVVDNGSKDDSKERIANRYPSIEIIGLDENLGYIKGANIGISSALKAGADMILLVNNDATIDPNALKTLMGVAKSQVKAGILGPKILYYGENIIWFAGGSFNRTWGFSTHPGIDTLDDGKRVECRSDFITGCVMLVKREVFEDIGLFDDSFWMYAEDLDFCLRALEKGWESWYVPSAIAFHKVSASSGVMGSNVMTPMRSYYYARNMMILVHRLPWGKGAFTRHLGQLAVRLPYYSSQIVLQGVKGGLMAYMRGLIDGLKWILGGGEDFS